MPKIIFLDWNKTLSYSKFWGHLGNSDYPLRNQYKSIEDTLFDKENNLVIPWMLGDMTSKEVCDIIGDKIDLDSNLIHSELEKSCRKMQFASSEVVGLLKAIKSNGIQLIIATDNMDTFNQYTYPEVDKLGIFDGYLNSCDLKCFKYDFVNGGLPFFDQFLQDNNLNYEDVVLIDDSIDKKGNYANLGFKIINIDSAASLSQALKSYA